ncbi:MAG: T9SS type A sorting domain-containing protein [Flavobacteriales bacterium]|jgi:hypothetical protein
MKQKSLVISCFLACLSLVAGAQQAATSSGGDFSGSGGSVAFSIGQPAYEFQSGSNGTSHAGVQQPFEFFTVWVDEHERPVSLEAFPNPTLQDIWLVAEGMLSENLEYRLFDLSGRMLQTDRIRSGRTLIGMQQLEAAPYMLVVLEHGKPTQTIQIIKNN